MRSRFLAGALAALALSAAAEPAHAQYLKDGAAKACAGYTYAKSEERVVTCTSIVEGRDRTEKGRAWAYAYRAGAYYELRKLDLALADANKAVELWPERLQGYIIRAATLTDLGRTDAALADLDRVVAVEGSYAAYLARGYAYYQKSDYERALADFSAALGKLPNSPAALMGRGNSYNALRRYSEAAKDFSVAISYASQEPRLLMGRAVAYDGLGQGDAALADYRRALTALKTMEKSDPTSADAWRRLGDGLFRHRDYPDALEADDHLVAKAPVAEAYNARCWHRGVANLDLPEARADCDRALELAPRNPDVLDSRGFVRFRLGDFAGAMADLDAALQAAPKSASSLYVRGLAKVALDGPQAGKADLEAAVAIQPDIAGEYAGYGVRP